MPFGNSAPCGGPLLVPQRPIQIVVQFGGESVQAPHERFVVGKFVQTRGADLAEQRHRITAHLRPQVRIDGREQVLRGLVPRPAQVDGEALQRDQSLGQMRADRKPAEGFHATQPY